MNVRLTHHDGTVVLYPNVEVGTANSRGAYRPLQVLADDGSWHSFLYAGTDNDGAAVFNEDPTFRPVPNQAPGTLEGLVADPAGLPVIAARVEFVDRRSSEILGSGFTDDSGRFQFEIRHTTQNLLHQYVIQRDGVRFELVGATVVKEEGDSKVVELQVRA